VSLSTGTPRQRIVLALDFACGILVSLPKNPGFLPALVREFHRGSLVPEKTVLLPALGEGFPSCPPPVYREASVDVRRCRPPDLKKASRSCSGSVRNPWLCDRASLMASPVKSFKRSSPTLKEAKALFTVPKSTVGFFEDAGPTALSGALERGNRTVRRARIAACGVTCNLLALLPQPISSVGVINNGVPRCHLRSAPRRATVGVQPTPVPGRCVQQRRGCEPGVQP